MQIAHGGSNVLARRTGTSCRVVLFAVLVTLLAIPLILLLAPTRTAVACPPPGIYIVCTGRIVHIWELAWWTGRTTYFYGSMEWIGVALVLGTVLLGAVLMLLARKCAIALPASLSRRSRG